MLNFYKEKYFPNANFPEEFITYDIIKDTGKIRENIIYINIFLYLWTEESGIEFFRFLKLLESDHILTHTSDGSLISHQRPGQLPEN